MSIREWVNSSLFGHVVLYETTVTIPLTVYFLTMDYFEGTLSAMLALRGLAVGLAAGTAITAAPLRAQRPRRREWASCWLGDRPQTVPAVIEARRPR